MKAIETIYNGYKFRSRLEARWAVFFDSLGVKYEYEPQGFKLTNGMYYLPDFKIKCYGTFGHNEAQYVYPQEHQEVFDLYIEVKGEMDRESAEKIKNFDFPILVLGNIPDVSNSCSLKNIDIYNIAKNSFDIKFFNYIHMFPGNDFEALPCADNEGHFFLNAPSNNYYNNSFDERVKNAYLSARQARFEHGECGLNGNI